MDLHELSIKAERCFLKVFGAYDLQPPETNDMPLREAGKPYGIKFITEDSANYHDLSFSAPSEEQVQTAGREIGHELGLYPEEIIRKSGIEQITFCTGLKTVKKRAAGTLMVGMHNVNTLFIDISTGKVRPWYFRKTFHHELFHAIDFRDTWSGYMDLDWPELQEQKYRYELDAAIEFHRMAGRDPLDPRPREFQDPYFWLYADESETPGFVTEYAKYSTQEDKAEIYSYLILFYNNMMARCAVDEKLARKVERMKQLLYTFSKEFNDSFWLRMAERKSLS
jgi:Putative zinc-binding metallo-peptidase